MYRVNLRKTNKIRRKLSVRKKIFGTADRPRLSVFRSNKYIYGQVIDDVAGKTLIDVGSVVKTLHKDNKRLPAAFELGKEVAARALKKNIKTVIFDRSSYRYHGRVKSFAEGARAGGLKF